MSVINYLNRTVCDPFYGRNVNSAITLCLNLGWMDKHEHKGELTHYPKDTPADIRKNFKARNTKGGRTRLARALKRSDRQQWHKETAEELAGIHHPEPITPTTPKTQLEYAVACDEMNIVGLRKQDGSIEEVCYWQLPEMGWEKFLRENPDPDLIEDADDLPRIRTGGTVSRADAAELRKMGMQTVRLTKTGNLRGVRSNPHDYAKSLESTLDGTLVDGSTIDFDDNHAEAA